jgi:hypothetical protein
LRTVRTTRRVGRRTGGWRSSSTIDRDGGGACHHPTPTTTPDPATARASGCICA